MTKADKRIAELEKRVKDLEARPAIVVLPAPVVYPYVQPAPYNHWGQWPGWLPIVTCSETSGNAVLGETTVTWSAKK